MKSLFKSKLSWFALLYLFEFLLPYAMEENEKIINTYSVKQLQNDFIGLKKNPQKYVEFQLNAEKTMFPNAGGLYELLPYYQKINPLGEKANYAIQWCDFENKLQLIKVNPLGDLPRLDVEQTALTTFLEGDQFSRPTNADIKAYTTYEQMKSVVKTVGEKNKELKIKIMEMEETIIRLQIKTNDEITSAQEANKKLEETFIKIKEQNKKLKAYALEQNNIANKVNEQNKIQGEENQKMHEDLENLKSNLKEKEIQITKKNEEKLALEYQKGDLAYKLSDAKEYEHKFLSLEKEVKPLKAEIKHLQAAIQETVKQWNIRTDDAIIISNQHIADMHRLNQQIKNSDNDKVVFKEIFKKFKHAKKEEINEMKKNWKNELEETQIKVYRDLAKFQNDMDESSNLKIEGLKEIYDFNTKKFKEEIDQQTKVINVQKHAIKFKDCALNDLLKKIQFRYDGFVSNSQEIAFENCNSASNYLNQTNSY